jgi:chloramphenicol 3-O phosphotransferase
MERGKIIILNGTSSSGKTSIVRALQDRLTEPYLEAGLDKFIWMLPRRYLDRPLWDDVLGLAVTAGAAGHWLVAGMHRTMAALSETGIHLIADHVLVEPAWLEDCARLFSDPPALLVGVRCPLEVLEEREQARKDRTLGQARAQFGAVHAHGVYDVEVDTSVSTPEECAEQILAWMEKGEMPSALRRLSGLFANSPYQANNPYQANSPYRKDFEEGCGG